jgi:hypothetical protein
MLPPSRELVRGGNSPAFYYNGAALTQKSGLSDPLPPTAALPLNEGENRINKLLSPF